MAKVVSVHEILLSWEALGREEEFERFMAEEFAPTVGKAAGATIRLLKGVRGDRMGRYVLFWEYPSTEAFTRLLPLAPGPFTEEARRLGQDPAFAAVRERYSSFVERWHYTDYLETGE